MSIELKIKQKHLSLEPAIIRTEERKLKKRIKYHRSEDKTSTTSLEWKLNSLTNHRKINVRYESRATHLARTYLAGKPYSYAERTRKECNEFIFNQSILPRVQAMVKKYGTGVQRKIEIDDLKSWAKV